MHNHTNSILPFVKQLEKKTSKPGTWVSCIDLERYANDVPFNVALFTVEANGESITDVHRVKEIWLIQSGLGMLEYNNQCGYVKEGDILFFDSFKTHKIINHSLNDIRILSIWWS